jgi:hypothetical protein
MEEEPKSQPSPEPPRPRRVQFTSPPRDQEEEMIYKHGGIILKKGPDGQAEVQDAIPPSEADDPEKGCAACFSCRFIVPALESAKATSDMSEMILLAQTISPVYDWTTNATAGLAKGPPIEVLDKMVHWLRHPSRATDPDIIALRRLIQLWRRTLLAASALVKGNQELQAAINHRHERFASIFGSAED